MPTIQKISVLSMAKLHGIVLGFVGCILGILYSFGGAIYDFFTIGLNPGTAMAFGALIAMPIIFGIAGYIAGAVIAVLFNVLAYFIGGIDLNIT